MYTNETDRLLDRLDEIDLALTLAGERDEPLPMGDEDALRAERASIQATLFASRERTAGRCPMCGGMNCKNPHDGRH